MCTFGNLHGVFMKVSITTKNGAVLSPFERKVIKTAAHFYAETLLTNRITNNMVVKINMIEGYHKKTGYLADVTPTDDDEKRMPREFEINMHRPKRLKSIIYSLAHEFVHVKQFAKGELKYLLNNRVTFNRMKYTDDGYWDSPWEIEAYGKEPGLWQRFKPIYKYLLRENRNA